MPYHCLAQLLEELADARQLAQVDAEVHADLEAAEIASRAAQRGGPAILFRHVQGHDVPVLANLLGTDARICRALDVQALEDLAHRVRHAAGRPPGPGRGGDGPASPAARPGPPRRMKAAPCQHVVRLGSDVDLRKLPALRSLPDETGPTITGALLVSVDPESGAPVAGWHPLQVLDANHLAPCWSDHDDLARLVPPYRRRGEPMPLAALLAADPAWLLAAAAPVCRAAELAAVAGLLRGEVGPQARCRTVALDVPAEAEMVIEGVLDPAAQPMDPVVVACPGGGCRVIDHPARIRVTALTHRSNPVFVAAVPAGPSDEISVLRRAMARVFVPWIQSLIPELVDCDLPLFGAAGRWAFVAIRKGYRGQAKQVAHAWWGLPAGMFTRFLVIVDEGVDLRQPDQVWGAVTRHADPRRDVWIVPGPPDPTCGRGETGDRVGIDATAKLPGEGPSGWVADASRPEELLRRVTQRWPEFRLPGEGPCSEIQGNRV